MNISFLQAKLWSLHANKAISLLRSSLLHKIWGAAVDGNTSWGEGPGDHQSAVRKVCAVPCGVWRHLPLCRQADFPFLGCPLNVFGCLGENSCVAGSGCLSRLMLAEPSAIALCYFTSMFSAHVAFLLPKYEDEPSGASRFYDC